jgi:hypothetical protein
MAPALCVKFEYYGASSTLVMIALIYYEKTLAPALRLSAQK